LTLVLAQDQPKIFDRCGHGGAGRNGDGSTPIQGCRSEDKTQVSQLVMSPANCSIRAALRSAGDPSAILRSEVKMGMKLTCVARDREKRLRRLRGRVW
jgi:hypothetical protein